MSNYTGRTELPPLESKVSVRLIDGVIVAGVVTGHGQKDGKPTFDFEYDHRTPEGQILKASKWAWPEQVQRNLSDTKDTKQGFLDSAGTFYPSIESVRTYMPAGRTIVSASDPLGEVDETKGRKVGPTGATQVVEALNTARTLINSVAYVAVEGDSKSVLALIDRVLKRPGPRRKR